MLKKHPCFDGIPHVKDICAEYFRHLDLHFFGHVTVSPDGKYHFMCSKHDWPEYRFVQGGIAPIGFTLYHQIENSILLPSMDTGADLGWTDQDILVAKERFGIKSPMVIFRKFDDHYEGFFFDLHDKKAYEKYLQNFDLFENFIFYYKDKAHKILEKAAENRLQVHEQHLQEKASIVTTSDLKEQNDKLLPKQYFLYHRSKNYAVSSREYQCLSLLAHGEKIKEIARSINLSARTVESHLVNLKHKLDLDTLSQAIEIYWKNRLILSSKEAF